jgi:hypothetical protein
MSALNTRESRTLKAKSFRRSAGKTPRAVTSGLARTLSRSAISAVPAIPAILRHRRCTTRVELLLWGVV